MARPRTVTDEQILQAARRCFIEGGPAVPLTRIASEVGVSPAAICKRMGSKSELLLKSLHIVDWDPPPLQWLLSGPTKGMLKPQLVRSLDGGFSMLSAQFPTLVALRLSDQPMFPDPDRPTPPERFRTALSDWIRRASARDGFVVSSPEVAAGLLVSSVQSHAFMNWVERLQPGENRPDWESLIEGVLPGIE